VYGRGSWALSTSSRESAAAVLAAAVVFLAAGCTGPPSRTWSGSAASEIVTHEVSGGETLETIADDYYGDRDAAAYLAWVNHVDEDEDVAPGDLLDVPASREDIARYERRTEAKLHYNRGTLFADRGDLEKAAEELRRALRVDPRFADAGYNLGVVLLMAGESARAVTIFEQVASVKPSDPSILYGLGKAYLDEERDEESLAAFEKALAVDPDHEDALFARAVALLRLGRTEDAVVSLDSYLRRFPGGVWADQARAELSAIAQETEQDR
jgi:tetratricopeptide (TPR) repeat protein